MRNKPTKRVLLASALAVMLCVTMLVGTTLAWFTDDVTAGRNTIQSGNLDVKMYWADGTKAVPTTEADWTDASNGAIFNYDNWEPGYVQVRHIKIENVGSLAFKYEVNIVPTGAVSDLADVIDVYYLDPAAQIANRSALTENNKLGTLTEVLANLSTTGSGSLLADESDTITIALKMQESAGNEYQGLSIGTNFSVILMATQDNVEKDAFDENYDDIEIPEMHIENINGVTYGVGADGNYYMISVDDYTLTTFTVDENVTVLGTGNGVNDNDRVFGKNAPLTSLTLPEGLTEIKDNALNALPNLTTVNIPSTLETIGIQSFRTTGMSEVTLPENVETVKLGAFRDMANLTTVTVEGNVAFDNYAFRSCPNLTSIYLLGDDVTFTGGQFATHSDNGDATGITIYVKNTTVAARVYAAQTSAYGYKVKVLGEAADGSDAVSVTQAKNATDLKTALAEGNNTVLANDVTVASTLNIPAGETVTLDLNGNDLSYAVANTGASAILNNTGTLNIVGEGTISFVAANPDLQAIPTYATNTITNTGSLTIGEGVTVTNGSEGGASYAVDNHGTFVLDGGTLIGNRCALRIAKYNQDNVSFVMNSGLVKAKTPAWIQLPGSNSADAPNITVTINGGTFESTKATSDENNVLYTYSYGNSHANTSITINGGQFLGGVVSIGSGYKGDAPALTITGGTFEYDVLQWLANDAYQVLYSANK